MNFANLIHELIDKYGERFGQRYRSIDVATEDIIFHLEWSDMDDLSTELENISVTIMQNDMNKNIVNTVHVNATHMSVDVLILILEDYHIL